MQTPPPSRAPSRADAPGPLSLGRLLAGQRIRAELTQEELAERTGLSVRGLRNIELDRVRRPRRRTVTALMEALRLGVAEVELINWFLRSAETGGGTEDDPAVGPAGSRFATPALPAAPRPFVGRERVTRELLDQLHRRRSAGVHLTGAAGTGKTALAVHLAHRLQRDFPDGQLLVPLDPARGPEGTLERVLRTLGTPAADLPAQPDAQRQLYRAVVGARRLLLIADGASDADVRLLLPVGSRSALIATSRSPLGAVDGLRRIALLPLPIPEGVRLLAELVGAERVKRDLVAARRIVVCCEGLPLALRVAGARLLNHPEHSLAWLAEELAVGASPVNGRATAGVGIRSGLISACKALSVPGRLLLGRLGQIGIGQFSAWLAAAAMDCPQHEAEELLDELVALQLIHRVVTPHQLDRRYALSGLMLEVASAVGAEQEPAGAHRSAHRRVLDAAFRRSEEARIIASSGPAR